MLTQEERVELYKQWHSDWYTYMPFLNWPEGWQVRVLPPLMDQVVRMQVKTVQGGKIVDVSLPSLSSVVKGACRSNMTAWQVDSGHEHIYRCHLRETSKLLGLISQGLGE